MKAWARTRSGWVAARHSEVAAPFDSDTTTARSVSVASSTARAASACHAVRYGAGSVGASDRPLPGPSKVTTRWRRPRWATCIFQKRLCTMVHVGSSRIVGAPVPVTS